MPSPQRPAQAVDDRTRVTSFVSNTPMLPSRVLRGVPLGVAFNRVPLSANLAAQ